MKRLLCVLVIITSLLILSSCFLWKSTKYPDMVEYTQTQILEVAKEKYSITEWIYIDSELRGRTWYTDTGAFKIETHDTQYSGNLVNGDNTEKALTAFAGKKGGHDVQGLYGNFLCYVALGKCADDTLKFIYYNTNIHKDAEIADTIGASDYTLEVLPTEINNSLFTAPYEWLEMQLFLNRFMDANPRSFIYSGKRLKLQKNYGGIVELEFYKENGEVVYDVYFDKAQDDEEERRLVYSTSDRYDVIYNYYGVDKSQYFNITQTVTQSPYEQDVMVLWGNVETKENDGTVIYSNIGYRATYQKLGNDGELIEAVSSDNAYDKLSFERGYGMEKIDGVDHTETAKFTVYDYYIFYKKNSATE